MNQKGVEFHDASEITGLDISDATDHLKERFGKQAAVWIIGVSGEQRMNLAGIAGQDKDGYPTRFNARGGLGAVMGSKGIKAIVLDAEGTEKIRPEDRPVFKEALKKYHGWLMETPATSKIFPEIGTSALVETTNSLGALPTRNFSTGSIEGHTNISGETLRETILERGGKGSTTHACMPGCLIRCSNVFADKDGNRVTGPIEYENIGLLGANLGITNLDEVAELNRLCNEYGTDTIETGGALGVLMSEGVTEFGDFKGACELLHELKQGTPMGKILGGGAAVAGKIYGTEFVPTAKNQTMPAYDPRAVKGLGVTFATSPQGADHTAGQTIRAQVDHHSAENQVETSKHAQLINTIWDNLGMCTFSSGAVKGRFDIIGELVSAYTGETYTEDDIMNMANATLKTEHSFNRKAGFTKADDRLSDYFYDVQNEASQTVFDVDQDELLTIGTERDDL